MILVLTGSDESEITVMATRVSKSGDFLTIELNQALIDPEPSKTVTFEVMEGAKSYGSWKVQNYNWTRDDKGFQMHQIYMAKPVAIPSMPV